MSKVALALILAAEFGRAADEEGRSASSTAATAAVCERCRNLLRVRTASAVTTTLPVENSWLGEFPELGVSTETFWLRQTLYTQTNKRFVNGPRCDRRVP